MIPNKIHYIHLSGGGREWMLHHYLSVKSAFVHAKANTITLWVDQIPQGHWWDLTAPMVNIQKVEPPTSIFDKPITQQAHKSDVLRLQILLEYGGIYVDTDTIFVKPFTDLLNHKAVLGQQGVDGCEGICPAVILAQPDSIFIRQWLLGFKDAFGGGPPGTSTWCTHSVNYPNWLATQLLDEVTILGHECFFWPLYHDNHIKALFEEKHSFPNAYSHHLWESSGKQYLQQLTLESIKNSDTTFTNLVKDLI